MKISSEHDWALPYAIDYKAFSLSAQLCNSHHVCLLPETFYNNQNNKKNKKKLIEEKND